MFVEVSSKLFILSSFPLVPGVLTHGMVLYSACTGTYAPSGNDFQGG